MSAGAGPRRPATLRLHHQPSGAAALEWAWVDHQLTQAGTV